jgi:p24 family protein delta-1
MRLLPTLLFSALASALKFDLPAHSSHSSNAERCIRNFVTRDTLVVVTAIVSGNRGDGMVVNMHIKDAVGNDYGRPKDVAGEKRMAFTSLADTAFDVCFENILTGRSTYTLAALYQLCMLIHWLGHQSNPLRHVELDIDIGADARDWSAIQANEKLKPVEADLRRIEETVNEIVSELEYLRIREQKLRDTNESTNERVKWFAFGTMGMLVGLGAWQVVYLRAYFRYVLIDPGWDGVANIGELGRSTLFRRVDDYARLGFEMISRSTNAKSSQSSYALNHHLLREPAVLHTRVNVLSLLLVCIQPHVHLD